MDEVLEERKWRESPYKRRTWRTAKKKKREVQENVLFWMKRE
jgi:hypothetical protein